MKLNKTIGRVATTLVATAMLASVAVVPAFAADDGVWGGIGTDDQANGTILNNSIELSKKLTKPTGVPTPNVTFTVNVNPVDEENLDGEKVDNIPVQAGPDGSVTISNSDNSFAFEYDVNDIQETSVDPVNGTDGDKTVTVQFNMGIFSAPGIYKYDVSETQVVDEDDTDEGYTTDSAFMYVYVVESGDTYAVENVVLTHTNTETGKIANLTNTYGTSTGTDDDVHIVDLTKKVEGNQGQTGKEFAMEIKIDPSNSGDNFRVVYGHFDEDKWVDDSTPAEIILNADNAYTTTVNLANGEYVRIYGLTDSDEYTITETDYSDDGYTQYANKDYENGDTYVNAELGRVIKDKTTEDTTVAFHNLRQSSTPTGIVMNVAPYALLVVVAAAGCFVFLRKRRED